MMDSIDISKATGLLGEIRKIIVHQDELIRQKQMDIEDLQRERDGLRQQVVQLTIQLESSHTNARIESPTAAVGGVQKATSKLIERAAFTRQSASLRDVDVKCRVQDYERRTSKDLEQLLNGHRCGSTSTHEVENQLGRSDDEGDDDVSELREFRRKSDATPPSNRIGGHVRRHTVAHRPPERRLFTSSGRRRRMTQRRAKLPPVNRNSSTWEGAYILSPDMEVRIREKILSELSKKYGDKDRISKAAVVIQTSFRGYMLRKHLCLIKAMPFRRRTPSIANFLLDISNHHPAPSLLRSSSACSPHGLCASQDRVRRARSTTPPRSMASPIHEASSTETDGQVSNTKEKVIEIVTIKPSVIVENAFGDDTSRELTPFDGLGVRGEDSTSVSSAFSESTVDSTGQSRIIESEMSLDSNDHHVHLPQVIVQRRGEGRTQQERLYQMGINHFNRNPNKGILFLVSEQLLEDSPYDVANFLLTSKGLSKLRIGEYLGDQNEFNVAVLHEVSNMIDLKGLSFVAALRKFQSHFILPGEAQKIDRIIEAFAVSFSFTNHGCVSTQKDTIFILAFSTIMLNTDLHNPSVKRRMTKEDFVKNNRGIDNGKDLSKFLLENVYESIKSEPLSAAEDHCSQVAQIEKQISGLAIKLAAPHRQLIQMNQVNEVLDPFKKQANSAHPRVVYLFNDLLLLVKENARRSPYKYHVKHCVALCGLTVKEFQNTNFKHGVTLESTYKKLHLSVSTSKQREMFVSDLQEVLIEVEDMESERLAEMETLAPPLARSRRRGTGLTRTDDWSNQSAENRRKSSVSLSPYLPRRSSSYSAVSISLDDIGVISRSSIHSDQDSLENMSLATLRSRSDSPTPSTNSRLSLSNVSNGSSRRGFLRWKKKDKS